MDMTQDDGFAEAIAAKVGAGAEAGWADSNEVSGVNDQMFDLGGDERRMHVRAYNYWVSLLKGQPYPAIADFDPASLADFAENSVVLDFTRSIDDPLIAYLGRTLREECGTDGDAVRITEVPPRSLLSRLTDHYLQIIANRAPIGFEAEFVSQRGHATLYRGILMPFSSDGTAIDYIYGVINWKEIADASIQAMLGAELDAALRVAPKASTAEVWADGPSGGFGDGEGGDAGTSPGLSATLDSQLMMARESAAAVRAADTRSRAALYRALGRAHDFGLAADDDRGAYARLLDQAGITGQARAPMTPVAKLVFGADYDKTRLTEFATVLGHARGQGVRAGELSEYLGGVAGGIKAVVAAARAARAKPRPAATVSLADRAILAHVDLAQTGKPGSLVVLVARIAADGGLEIMGQVDRESVTASAVKALG